MIRIKLYVQKKIYKLFLSCQMKFNVRFLVISFSKVLFSISVNSLNFLKKVIQKMKNVRKLNIVSSLGMMSSIKIS